MKNKYICALVIAIIVPVVMIFFFLFAGKRINRVDTREGQSYMAALDNNNAGEIEEIIRNQHTEEIITQPVTEPVTEAVTTSENDTLPDTTDPDVTQPDTQPATQPPTTPSGPVNIEPNGAVSEAGFVYSALGSYNPYTFDANKANDVAGRLESGSVSYREIFSSSCFIGDSVMDGFDCYMHFPNTFTAVGVSMASHLPTIIDRAISTYPKYIFIRYGLNEMGTTEDEAATFANTYKGYIAKMKTSLPNTKIIVIGITPVGPAALNKSQRLGNGPLYNAKIKAMCMELGVGYYENSYLFLNNTHLYSKDGIHIDKQMYEIWLRDMVTGMGIY